MENAGKKLVEPDIDGVLLTHAHADHADYISFLHEKIPIYMGNSLYSKTYLSKSDEERS